MRPPSLRLTYASSAFQKNVVGCFGGQLPWLMFNEDGVPFFEYRDEAGRETCILSRRVANLAEIPRTESLRLLEGWLRLQTLAMNPNLDPIQAGMMSTFMLPDPSRDMRQYRIIEGHAGRNTRLHVLWGFTTKTNPRSAILAELAICKLLGVETDVLAMVAEQECDAQVYDNWASAVEMSA